MFTTSHMDQLHPKSTSSSSPSSNTKSGKTSYKHIPHREKPPHLVAKRNARERRRVQAVNSAFARLRKCVPLENRNKRLSKVKTLIKAIEYIEELKNILGPSSGDSSFEEHDQLFRQLNQVSSGLDHSPSSSYTSLPISDYEIATESNNSSSFNTNSPSISFTSLESDINQSNSKLPSSAININNNCNNNSITIHGNNDNLILPVLDPYNNPHIPHHSAQSVLHPHHNHHMPTPPHHQWYSHASSVEPVYNWTNPWLDKQQS